jgi:hypothetical protein
VVIVLETSVEEVDCCFSMRFEIRSPGGRAREELLVSHLKWLLLSLMKEGFLMGSSGLGLFY